MRSEEREIEARGRTRMNEEGEKLELKFGMKFHKKA
jgi:hypothetical protein